MTPHYADEWLSIYEGDCRDVLRELPADSVDCVVTSPPYWGLRDYGHVGQLGLERTPEEYVANMVAVFAEVRRVLKSSGTCWLNLGDTFAANRSYQVPDSKWKDVGNKRGMGAGANLGQLGAEPKPRTVRHQSPALQHGLKPKDLVGIPWRVAFALRADGWYLRSDIIWSKPNPMPESVTDRPTKSHEYLFLLTKSARYYFDQQAVAEEASYGSHGGTPTGSGTHGAHRNDGNSGSLGIAPRKSVARGGFNGKTEAMPGRNAFRAITATRNIRSVWTIATRPYPGAHFAVFPPELPERCIKAGSSEKGVCPECGAPWERVVERVPVPRDLTAHRGTSEWAEGATTRNDADLTRSGQEAARWKAANPDRILGWRPTCEHWECADCGNIGHGQATVAHMLGMQAGVPDSAQQTESLLLADVRESGDEQNQEDHQGLRQDGEGLHSPVPAGASHGDEDRLHLGTSLSDGGAAWAEPAPDRSRGSHQRGEGRQPARESARDDENGPRQALEQGPQAPSSLSALRASLPAEGPCRQRGSHRPRFLAPRPSVVLDCFGGSGTVGMVANRLSRRATLVDLNPEYLVQQLRRNAQVPLGLTGDAA